jgi:hypothetical protein
MCICWLCFRCDLVEHGWLRTQTFRRHSTVSSKCASFGYVFDAILLNTVGCALNILGTPVRSLRNVRTLATKINWALWNPAPIFGARPEISLAHLRSGNLGRQNILGALESGAYFLSHAPKFLLHTLDQAIWAAKINCALWNPAPIFCHTPRNLRYAPLDQAIWTAKINWALWNPAPIFCRTRRNFCCTPWIRQFGPPK